MDYTSNHSVAPSDQVAESASLLPTLADLSRTVKSAQQTLYRRYVADKCSEGCVIIDEYGRMASHDNALVHKSARLMEDLESEHVKSAMRHANYYSGISTAADNFTGGLPFDTPDQRKKRLYSMMAEGGKLDGINHDMTEFLSKRQTAMGKLRPNKPLLTDDQTKRQERFAEDVVDEMSVCADTALALLPKKPSFAHASKQGPKDDTPEELRSRLLALYADKNSMTCGTANEFFQAIHPALDNDVAKYKRALGAFKDYSDDYTTAAAMKVTGERFDSKSLIQKWPDSFEPKYQREPATSRQEILAVSHIMLGSESGDQYGVSQNRQKTGNELLRDAVQATRSPDPTVPGDYERWLCEVDSALLSRVPPSDMEHSPKIPPSKPTKSSQDVVWPMADSSQRTELNEGTDTRTDWGAEQK